MKNGNHVIELWLRRQVGLAYDGLKADPARAVTIAPIRPLGLTARLVTDRNEVRRRYVLRR
jgi:hypothetical protein